MTAASSGERPFAVSEPGAGRVADLGGGVGVVFKLLSEDTGGTIAIVEHPFAAGALVEPHLHTREDEYSYVLEGEIGFRSGDREVTLGAGGAITKPRHELHSMWNAGPDPARLLEVISPGGFERFFMELGDVVATGDPIELGMMEGLAERYGLSFDMAWVPDLVSRYGLTYPLEG